MPLYFAIVANLYGLWRWLAGRPRPAEIIHTTCGMSFGADLASVHFVNCVWLRKQAELGFETWKEILQFALHCGGAALERMDWCCPLLKKAWSVSDSVGEEVRRRCRAALQRETLPNAFDEARFSPEVRAAHPPAIRAQHGCSGSPSSASATTEERDSGWQSKHLP